jgi:acetyl esterase/lipase
MKLNFQNVMYGDDESQNFDIIIPSKKEAHAIVYIHGGAYLTGNKLQYPSFLPDYKVDRAYNTAYTKELDKTKKPL